MATSILITADQFSAMTFDSPAELIKGEVVAMTNPGGVHGAVCFHVAGVLRDWIRAGAPFCAMTNDSGVLIERDPDTVRGPDVLVIRRDRLPEGKIPRRHFTVPPDVAIEVKSPADRWREVIERVSQFLKAGIAEVWVIDPDHFRVHVYLDEDEPTILNHSDQLQSRFLPGFSCSVSDLFVNLEPAAD